MIDESILLKNPVQYKAFVNSLKNKQSSPIQSLWLHLIIITKIYIAPKNTFHFLIFNIFFADEEYVSYHLNIQFSSLINIYYFQISAFPIILNPPAQYFEHVFKIPSGNLNIFGEENNLQMLMTIQYSKLVLKSNEF